MAKRRGGSVSRCGTVALWTDVRCAGVHVAKELFRLTSAMFLSEICRGCVTSLTVTGQKCGVGVVSAGKGQSWIVWWNSWWGNMEVWKLYTTYWIKKHKWVMTGVKSWPRGCVQRTVSVVSHVVAMGGVYCKVNPVALLSTSRKQSNVRPWSSVDGLRWNYYSWHNLATYTTCCAVAPKMWQMRMLEHLWLTHPHQISLQFN